MKCVIYYSYIRSMQRYVMSVVDKDNGIEYKTLYAKNKSELGSIIEDIKSEFDVVEIKTGSPSQFANKLHIKLQSELSDEQTEFFKHSKIRDSNGLLKCIHSTTHKFSTFDRGSFGSNYRWGRVENMGQFGPGFYFSVYNEEDELSDRGRFPVGHMFYTNSSFRYWQEVLYNKDTKSFNNMVCYLNISSPFTFDKKTKLNEVFDDKQLAHLNEVLNRNMSGESEIYYSIFYRGTVDLQKVTSMLKDIGYDGIWFTETGYEGGQVIAFYPEQIKSVTNLSPTNKSGINEDMNKKLFIIQGNHKETMTESMPNINWLDSSVKTIRNELSNLPEGAKLIIKVSNAHTYDRDTWKTMPITYTMTKKDDSKLTSSVWSYVKEEVSYKGANNISMGQLSEIISSGGNQRFGYIDSVEVIDTLTEKKKKKKKRLGGTLNPDAGNVEHNINMFNHMNSPTGGPSNNPVSGPFGGDVSAPAAGGCCEAFEKSKKELIEGMRLTNGMREDEHYYFDDGNYSYHFFSKQDLYGITNQFAILVVDYGFEFHYDKMYRDEKSNMDVIPTTMRHERPKKICYFEFDEGTQPDIVDAFLDDDMNAFRNAVKAATEKEIEKNPLVEKRVRRKFRLYYWDPSVGKYDPSLESYADVEAADEDDAYAKFMTDTDMKYEITGFEEFILNNPMRKSLGESAETKYYMAKYRGVNTDRLHKVYFSCEGNFEDAENLLDALIAEPYTDARVLGTVSPAEAERDGFTKIGGTSNKELDDDFNMSTRTLW